MPRFAIAVMGPDRPGIVAAVSASLLELGCNLEDVATSILSGYFSMMMVVTGQPDSTVESVRAALLILEKTDLATAVWPIDGSGAPANPTHVLTAYGPDATGIVHAISADLAAEGVDICDMVCRLHGGDVPVYVVTMEVKLPGPLDPDGVRARISSTGKRLGLDTSLTEIEQSDL